MHCPAMKTLKRGNDRFGSRTIGQRRCQSPGGSRPATMSLPPIRIGDSPKIKPESLDSLKRIPCVCGVHPGFQYRQPFEERSCSPRQEDLEDLTPYAGCVIPDSRLSFCEGKAPQDSFRIPERLQGSGRTAGTARQSRREWNCAKSLRLQAVRREWRIQSASSTLVKT